MHFPVLICDDSNLARRMVLRSLPSDWNAEIIMAENGLEAMKVLTTRHISLMFLDLTMPEMDGIEVLQEVKKQKIETFVIVVSGDIQPKMQERVQQLGALSFIKKPIDYAKLERILLDYGLYDVGQSVAFS